MSTLPPMSAKRRANQPTRTAVNKFVHDRDRYCRFFDYTTPEAVPIAHGFGFDVHEKCERSSWSGGYLDPANCVLLCRVHHRWVDDNRDAAEACGLLIKSWNRPDGAA
jgi:hypothetical protein